MKIAIKIVTSLISIVILLMVIEAFTGFHLGLTEVFGRLIQELKGLMLFM